MELSLDTDATSVLDQHTAQFMASGHEPCSGSETARAIWQCEYLCTSRLEDKYPEGAWSVSQQGPICPAGEAI